MLGAIDERLAAQAPNVMVSHSMQGDCLCENAPGLRIDYSNMEIAAVPAPRPQILVAATGDWTKMTLTIEGPAIQSIYQLFQAPEKLRYVRFDFEHNYNKTSREAVYEWFGQWLLHHPNPTSLKELPYQKEPNEALRVFPDGKLPNDALDEEQLIGSLIELARSQLQSLNPVDQKSLDHFKKVMRPAWRHTLQVELPERGLIVEASEIQNKSGYTLTPLHLGRAAKGDRIPVLLLTPDRDNYQFMVVLAHPQGKSAFLEEGGLAKGLAKQLLEHHYSVVLLDAFLTGEQANEAALKARNPFANIFPTYNRTDLQERVQDLITACAFARRHEKGRRVLLCGLGRAGLWSLLAAPVADVVVADCDSLDLTTDTALMQQELFVPGIRKFGGFESAAMLALPHPLLIHNAGSNFSIERLRASYAALRVKDSFKGTTEKLTDEAILSWVDGLKAR